MIRYRTETFSGLEERDAVKVMAFETFEMGNDDILETLKDGILKNHEMAEELGSILLDRGNNIEGFKEEKDQREFFSKVLKAIEEVSGFKVRYALWLADLEPVRDFYGKAEITEDEIDAYETGPVVLSDLDYEGALYGYEALPEPVVNF